MFICRLKGPYLLIVKSMKCVENSEQFEAAFLISLSIFIQVLLKLHIYLLLKVTIDHTLGSALRLQHSCSHGNKKRDFFLKAHLKMAFFHSTAEPVTSLCCPLN